MNLQLPGAAHEFATSLDRAIARAGGRDLTRRCEQDPASRAEVNLLLSDLGALGLDPCGDVDEVMAAVEACRIAGRHTLPWPLAATLAAADGRRLVVIDPQRPRIVHGDLGTWVGVSLDRVAFQCAPSPRPIEGVLAPFVVEMDTTPDPAPVDDQRLAAALWLQVATSVGALQEVCRLTLEHVTAREQFGRRLADFQSVKFKLADMTVAERGLRELLYFTAWAGTTGQSQVPVADALALRVAVIDHGKELLRTAHQLHGALGFCDEHDLSLLSRHLQPQLRLPHDLEASTEALDAELFPVGLDALCHDL